MTLLHRTLQTLQKCSIISEQWKVAANSKEEERASLKERRKDASTEFRFKLTMSRLLAHVTSLSCHDVDLGKSCQDE